MKFVILKKSDKDFKEEKKFRSFKSLIKWAKEYKRKECEEKGVPFKGNMQTLMLGSWTKNSYCIVIDD